MAILRPKEMKKMSEEELNKKVEELKLDLSKKRAQIIVGGAPENGGKIREMKKTIARVLTIKNEKKVIKNQ